MLAGLWRGMRVRRTLSRNSARTGTLFSIVSMLFHLPFYGQTTAQHIALVLVLRVAWLIQGVMSWDDPGNLVWWQVATLAPPRPH